MQYSFTGLGTARQKTRHAFKEHPICKQILRKFTNKLYSNSKNDSFHNNNYDLVSIKTDLVNPDPSSLHCF